MNLPVSMNQDSAKRSTSRGRSWLASAITVLLFSAPAFGHKTFLATERHLWEAGDTVEVGLTSALEFPNVEYGPALDRVSFTSAVVANTQVQNLSFAEGERALSVSFQAEESGFSVVAMSTHPRAGEISPEGAAAYFDEIEAPAAIRQAFEDLPGSPPLNRSYSKHTKVFLCIDSCETGQESAHTPVGQALEFIGVANEERSFALYRHGQAVENQRVTIYSDTGEQTFAVTNEHGVILIDPSIAGVVLLSAVWVTAPDEPSGVYHSDQATLTFRLEETG